MLISQLDGFLTGIAAGPQRVPVHEWLPSVWGGAEATFSDTDQETAVLEAIMRRYNEIARSLEQGFVDSICLTAPDGTPIISHRAAGFLDGIWLHLDAWKPLLMSEWRSCDDSRTMPLAAPSRILRSAQSGLHLCQSVMPALRGWQACGEPSRDG